MPPALPAPTSRSQPRPRPFLAGVQAMAPIVIGLAPFGLTVGATAAGHGLSPLVAAATTVGVYSGSAQLISVELLAAGAAPLVLLGVVGMVNARMVLFSAGVRDVWAGSTLRSKALAAYLLVDPVYLLSRARQDEDGETASLRRHYLGAALTLWGGWVVANAAGFAVGGNLPTGGPIMLATPLVLVAMASSTVTSRPALAAATVSAATVLALDRLPHDLGFVVAGLAGIVTGVALDARRDRRAQQADPDPEPADRRGAVSMPVPHGDRPLMEVAA
jgi:predicted branched-subunit amino acid permease